MNELLKKGSIVVVLGSGGVGKTTVAAAIGLAGARRGLKTGLITVDPARRLRDALGLAPLSAQPLRLDGRRLRAAGLERSTPLWAMTLDVKRTWDGLVEQLVKAPAARRRILENSFYRSLTQQFAGAEAYAALEQLHELEASGGFDLEVVDTPPAAHAFEFFEAPARLVRLLDSRAARWLFNPEASVGRGALALAGRAANFVVNQLETFAGTRMLSAIGEFFAIAGEAAGLIVERFRSTEAMLHSPKMHFVLVTTTAEDRLKAALELAAQTRGHGLHLSMIVLNRLFDERTVSALQAAAPPRMPRHLAEIARLREVLGEDRRNRRAAALIHYLETYADRQRTEIIAARNFARRLPSRVALTSVPEVELGVRDLRSLARLATMLTTAGSGRKFLTDAAQALGPASPRRGIRPLRLASL